MQSIWPFLTQAQELFPVGMGHTTLLWEDEPEKISYREELLILEGLIGEALAETCSVGLWGENEGGLSQWMEQRADMALSFLSSVLGTSKGLDYMEPLPAGVHRNWSCSGQTSPGGHLAVTEDITDRHGVEVLPPSNRSYSVYRSLPSTTHTHRTVLPQ